MAIFKDAERSSLAKEHTTRPARAMHNANRSGEDLSIIIHDPDTFLENKTNTTPTTHAARADEEDDSIVLPTPICATYPCKIISADGREATIYTPIDGFEHLFKPRHDSPGTVYTNRWPDAYQPAPRVRHVYSPGASQQEAGGGHHRGQRAQGEGSLSWIPVPAKKAALPVSRRKNLKRSRSISQALSRPSLAQGATDAEDEEANDNVNRNFVFATRSAESFHIGDMKGLKRFLRFRLDELTMKPLRPIVTAWIKLIEPRRSGNYGPYHKLLPADAPQDATPPWWPADVEYNEPSHLSKAALLILAVDVMLQHRPSPTDEVKRQGAWTARLRQAAEYAVDTTPPELYSSSKDAAFSVKMRDRALNSVMPSLFDVAQSYEDYVFQHNLWERLEDMNIPKGKSHTWHAVPRPTRPQAQRKRVCEDTVLRSRRKVFDVDAHSSASGEETEIDERLVRRHMLRRARREAQLEEACNVEALRSCAAAEADTPASSSTASRSDFHLNSLKSIPNSSFDKSMGGLVLLDDAKGGNDPTSGQSAEQVHCDMMLLDQPMQYPRYTIDGLQPSSGPNTFTSSDQQPQTRYPVQNFIDNGDTSMFNGPFNSPMIGNAMTYPYQDRELVHTTLGIPASAAASFNGLPYGYHLHHRNARPYYMDALCVRESPQAF